MSLQPIATKSARSTREYVAILRRFDCWCQRFDWIHSAYWSELETNRIHVENEQCWNQEGASFGIAYLVTMKYNKNQEMVDPENNVERSLKPEVKSLHMRQNP